MPTAMIGGHGGVVLAEDLPEEVVATPMAKAHNGNPMAVAMIDQKGTGGPHGRQGPDPGEDSTRDAGAPQGTAAPHATLVFQLQPMPSSGTCQ